MYYLSLSLRDKPVATLSILTDHVNLSPAQSMVTFIVPLWC